MEPLLKLSDHTVVAGLCLLAAVRVLVYSAGFPFFNNIDEQAHFDLVVKYSHGHVPRALEPMSAESCRYMALYASPEYFRNAQDYRGGEFPPPLWSMPEAIRTQVLGQLGGCEASINHESSQAPLYYAVAAVWFRMGQAVGLTGGYLLYWIRFLNLFLAAALVWLGYAAARQSFPDDRFMRLGVPLVLAVLPQDAYYSIQNDVLSPICFGLAFLGLVAWFRAEKPGIGLSVGTGLALAAVCLVKVSNLPLLAVAGVAVLAGVWRRPRAVATLLFSAGILIACWIAWNLANFGDATASAAKIQVLGWTRKPIGEWLPHPIFTPGGFYYFWSNLMPLFWRGELVWGLQRLASPVVDAFYWISSAVLTGAAAIRLLPRFGPAKGIQRSALMLALAAFFASVGYLAMLSMAFDFGESFYPSRVSPYFISGRLLIGAVVPFSMLYLYGLSWVTRLRWWLLLGIVVLLAGSQAVLDSVAFSSAYNWFHLGNIAVRNAS